jgi:hypothetical protein
METTEQNGKNKEEKNTIDLSLRNREARHNFGNALMESVMKIGTQSNMKSNRKTLHKFSPSHRTSPQKR